MPWDDADLPALLTLDAIGPGRWRSRHGDANQNGRSFGGQLLGQAMMAALLEAPPDRPPTAMQFLFLQGAMPDQPLEFEVTRLQEGKRFSSLHVRAGQAGRVVLDAHVTCALALPAPEHAEPSPVPPGEHPESLPGLGDLGPEVLDAFARLGGYPRERKPSIAFRIPDAQRQFGAETAGPGFRFWMKAAHAVPQQPRLQAAAFAYLSDWWLNFSSVAPHLGSIGGRRLYMSSLNHGMWMHRPPRADQWLHVESRSPVAAEGRGFAVARIHDLQGRLVASATQESLMAYAD
ncbi:MAG: acyl-CoA thioesterase [Ramlibacter sp.]